MSCGSPHHDPVVLPDGTTVRAASFPSGGYHGVPSPEFGLYFDPRWQPPWHHQHLDWPDFGLPAYTAPLLHALEDLLRQARRGTVVEIGCLGGHGRTGTALAMLAVLVGYEQDAVAWVRTNYCELAIETEEQATLVRRIQASAAG